MLADRTSYWASMSDGKYVYNLDLITVSVSYCLYCTCYTAVCRVAQITHTRATLYGLHMFSTFFCATLHLQQIVAILFVRDMNINTNAKC